MAEDKAWLSGNPAPDSQKHAPATLRNRDAIAAILRDILPRTGDILEIASGTGEHTVYFAEQFPALRFQPSDPDPECRASISSWTQRAEAANIAPPLPLDATDERWNVTAIDAVLCINMVHISPWESSIGLFKNAAKILRRGAPLYLYGPYLRSGAPTSESNHEFERSLKSRDLRWGLRDVADMDALASANGFSRSTLIEMPANNLSLIYNKQ